MAYQSINPFNGELLQTFEQHSDAQMESALAKADSTFQNVWLLRQFQFRVCGVQIPLCSAFLVVLREEHGQKLLVHRATCPRVQFASAQSDNAFGQLVQPGSVR